MTSLVDALLETAQARTFGDLAHELLRELEALSGLDSVFLARIDAAQDTFELLYTRNVRPERLNLLEGAVLPWSDTVCRRALAEGVRLTHVADARWPEIVAVEDTGICTYVLEPVCDDGGRLLGTLCAVSQRRLPVSEETRLAMRVIAPLLARQMQLQALADPGPAPDPMPALDPGAGGSGNPGADPGILAELPGRHGLAATLARHLAGTPYQPGRVCLALVDLLGFETFDAWHGHWAADRLLAGLAGRLRAVLGPDEYLARYGDREFAVVLPLAGSFAQDARAGAALGERLRSTLHAHVRTDRPPMDGSRVLVDTTFSRLGENVPALLHRADAALWRIRRTFAADTGAETPVAFG